MCEPSGLKAQPRQAGFSSQTLAEKERKPNCAIARRAMVSEALYGGA